MKITRALAFVLIVAFAGAVAVEAQQAPAKFMAFYNITVKPGHAMEFEDFLTKLKAGADKIGAPQNWGVGQIAFGGPGGAYAIALPFNEWGDMDAWKQAPQTLAEAYGKEEGAKIYRAGTMAIQESATSVARLDEDLSYNAGAPAATMYAVRVSEVHRDKQDQYRLFVGALNEAWKQAGDSRTVIRRTNVLGESTVYTSARAMSKWSDLDEGSDIWSTIEKAHGPMLTRRMRTIIEESVKSSERFVVAFRPDLSRMPQTSSSNE